MLQIDQYACTVATYIHFKDLALQSLKGKLFISKVGHE